VNIGDEVKAFQKLHPFLSFEDSWNYVRAAHPEFENFTVESRRIAAKLAPQREDEAREKAEHVEIIARRLMQRNPRLTFGAALQMTRDSLPAVQAQMAEELRQAVEAETDESEPRTMLIMGDQASYVD
jgi:hypothetical protein